MAKIAMPLAEDFEDSEVTVPCDRFENAGHEVVTIGSKKGDIVVGKQGDASLAIDRAARDVSPDDFDALVIPGGDAPGRPGLDRDVADLVRRFRASGKPVALITSRKRADLEAFSAAVLESLAGGERKRPWVAAAS